MSIAYLTYNYRVFYKMADQGSIPFFYLILGNCFFSRQDPFLYGKIMRSEE
jgi:hypothetical protein